MKKDVLTSSLWFLSWLAMPGLCFGSDTSLRLDLNANYRLSERFRSTSYVFVQANDYMSRYHYTEWGTGLECGSALKWLSFLVYFQQSYSYDDRRNWLAEHKPSMNINTRTTFLGYRISNQLRYEYRMTPDWNDYRIKNTLEIGRPDLFLQPAVGWELFYENRDGAVMLHRIKFGVTRMMNRYVSMGPYYRIDFANENHRWELTRHLVGFHVTVGMGP